MYDVKTLTQLWIAAFWTMSIAGNCLTSAIVVWLLYRALQAGLRGDGDLNAPQPAELRHSDAIRLFQLRHPAPKSPRARGVIAAGVSSAVLLAFLVAGYWYLATVDLF